MIGEKRDDIIRNWRAENQTVPVTTSVFFFSLHKSLLEKNSRKSEKHLEHVGVFVAKQFDYISRDVMLFDMPDQLILTEKEERARTHSNVEFQKVLPCRC